VFEGVDLLLRASSENVEKLFYVKPGHSPDSISVKLSGVRSVNISEEGLLVIETEALTVFWSEVRTIHLNLS